MDNSLEKGELKQIFASSTLLLDQNMVEKVHENMKELEQTLHNHTVGGIDTGYLKTNAVDTRSIQLNTEKEKQEKDEVQWLLNLIELQEWFDNMLEKMSDILEDIRENDRKIREGLTILKDQDSNEARLFLMDEYNYEPEELEKLSNQEILEKLSEETHQTALDQKELKHQLKQIADDYRQKAGELDAPTLKQEYMDKLEKLETEADKYNLDYDQALDEVRAETSYNNELILAGDGEDKIIEIQSMDKNSSQSITSELDELSELTKSESPSPNF